MIWATADNQKAASVAFSSVGSNRWVSASIAGAAIFYTRRPRQIRSVNFADIGMDFAILGS
tara:strand:- start:55 stop:237 length:183 start_codon:yes stop_codon:yes gene_type:complete